MFCDNGERASPARRMQQWRGRSMLLIPVLFSGSNFSWKMIMATLAYSLSTGKNQQQTLERKDLGSCPLGTVGNLQFKAAQGGTKRASRVGVLLSQIRRTVANLVFFATCNCPAARTRRAYVNEARDASRHVGNLLGILTAPANDAKARSTVAKQLMLLAGQTKSDLSGLPGGQESLSRYVKELSDADLIALYNGAARCQVARKAVLDLIPDGESRTKAEAMLNQVQKAVERQFELQVVGAPLAKIAGVLADSPVDGRLLKEPLIRLGRGLEQFKASRDASSMKHEGELLDAYFNSVSKAQQEVLLLLGHPDKRKECLDVLAKDKAADGPAGKALNLLADAMEPRVAQTVHAPLAQVAELLSSSPIDGSRLEAALLKVDSSFSISANLGRYLQSLPKRQLQALLPLGVPGKRYECHRALVHAGAKEGPQSARKVLDEIANALQPQLTQSVHAPLAQIAELLSASPMDGRKLEAALIELDSSPASNILELEHYLATLPKEQLRSLRTLELPKKQTAPLRALLELGTHQEDPARKALARLQVAVKMQLTQAVQESLGQIAGLLSASPIDGQKLEEALLELESSPPAITMLERYLASLPKAQLEALLTLGLQEKRNECLNALAGGTGDEKLAVNVLNQIANVMEPRLVQTVHAPLTQIAGLLSASPVDGRKLEAALLELERSPAIAMLERYLPSLPKAQLEALLTLGHRDKTNACYDALDEVSADHPLYGESLYNALDRITEALEPQFAQTVHMSLTQIAQLLATRPIDGRKLEELLIRLDSTPHGDMLKSKLFPSLPEELLKALLPLAEASALNECLAALPNAVKSKVIVDDVGTDQPGTNEVGNASVMLRRLHQELALIAQGRLHVGNLLNGLRGRSTDLDLRTEAINALEWLSKRSAEKTAARWMGQDFLLSCIHRLSIEDCKALLKEALASDLSQIQLIEELPPELRAPASELLDRIRPALILRLVEDFAKKPFDEIAELLSNSSIDGQKLKEQLLLLNAGVYENSSLAKKEVHGAPAFDILDSYLPFMPDATWEKLLGLTDPEKLNECLAALEKVKTDEKEDVSATLNSIQELILPYVAHQQK